MVDTMHAYGHNKETFKGIINDDEQLLRIIHPISRGCKGIHYRYLLPEFVTDEEKSLKISYLKNVGIILSEIKPYLRMGEFVERMAITSENLVEAATLLCGDSGILLFLINHDVSHPCGRGTSLTCHDPNLRIYPIADPFKTILQLPDGMTAKNLFEVTKMGVRDLPYVEMNNNSLYFWHC